MRYAGQGHEILVDLPDGPFTMESVAELQKRFDAGYRALFGRVDPGARHRDHGLDPEGRGAGAGPCRRAAGGGCRRKRRAGCGRHAQLFDPMLREFAGVPVYARADVEARPVRCQGPAVIAEDETTTIITSGFTATLDPSGAIRLLARKAVLQEAAQ